MKHDPLPFLNLKPQYESLKPKIHEAIDRVLSSTAFVLGSEVSNFEADVAKYLGTKHAIGVNSGTDALIIGLRMMGIEAGDEVITSPFTFFATAEAISNIGAIPVFVDVEYDSMNINTKLIEAAITNKTKAIMPVHLFGYPCAIAEVMKIALQHGLRVIEDCAQSFGCRIQGKQSGTFGVVGAFSFFPTKPLGAYGDGGLIITDDDEMATLARMLRVHGSVKRYYNEILGYNSRLDAIQAAILQVKLPYVDPWNEQRRLVASRYNELLSSVPFVVTPELCDGHVFHQYTIRITQGKRNDVQKHLTEVGISNMVYYEVPIDLLPVYAGKYKSFPVSQQLSNEVLSLPIWPEIEMETQGWIVEAIKSVLK